LSPEKTLKNLFFIPRKKGTDHVVDFMQVYADKLHHGKEEEFEMKSGLF
jgi:hemerythrin-like domain-containing protein